MAKKHPVSCHPILLCSLNNNLLENKKIHKSLSCETCEFLKFYFCLRIKSIRLLNYILVSPLPESKICPFMLYAQSDARKRRLAAISSGLSTTLSSFCPLITTSIPFSSTSFKFSNFSSAYVFSTYNFLCIFF